MTALENRFHSVRVKIYREHGHVANAHRILSPVDGCKLHCNHLRLAAVQDLCLVGKDNPNVVWM